MTTSIEVRQHALLAHIQPARENKTRFIGLKTGEINKELGWAPRCRQIIAALWADEFEEMARVRNLGKPGPKSSEGSAVVLRFEILS